MPSVDQELEAYLAGRVKAEQVVNVVAAEYYREAGQGKREALRPLIEVIERAHPGVIELTGSSQTPGFEVRLASRPFPKAYEGQLRSAVEGFLRSADRAPRTPEPGIFGRIVGAIRRLFTAST